MIPDAHVVSVPDSNASKFLEANTKEVTFNHLKNDTIIPVFSKDNECTISHPEFIESTQHAILEAFPNHRISAPNIRVSHNIKGRVPSAIGKPAMELLAHEKTIYYERMAFLIKIEGVQQIVNGNMLDLVVGGVRAYNQENLYSKKSIEKFKIFVGYKNTVCTNLCISTDGYKDEVRVTSTEELQEQVEQLFLNYDEDRHLGELERFSKFFLNRKQFAHMLGKLKLYQYLGLVERKNLFPVSFNDSMINAVSKSYFQDNNFRVGDEGLINLWNLYNLFTGAVKSSYIDSFLKRECQAYEFTQMLANAMQNDEENYFLIP
jgi:hypothetical protein